MFKAQLATLDLHTGGTSHVIDIHDGTREEALGVELSLSM